jgi:hypothetical protein
MVQVATLTSANMSSLEQQSALGTVEVVLLSYDTLRRHVDSVKRLNVHAVIFDEASLVLGAQRYLSV